MPHDDPLVTRDGKLSVGKLELRGKPYAEACRRGVKCKVLKHIASQRYPRVASILQAARNTVKKVEQSENEVQIMLRMHNKAGEMMSAGVSLSGH